MASNQTIVLITGANQGVGFETAKNLILADAKYHVLIGSRDPLKGEHAVSNIKAYPAELLKGTFSSIQLDVTSEDSIDAAVKQVEDNYGRLDVLVNNAGTSGLDNPSPRDTIRAVYAVNVFGAVSTTEAFLPLLKKAAAPRLIFVSSSTGSITHASDPTHRMHIARGMEYRSSKTALNMIMVQYWLKTKDEGFKVFGADPGLIATNLTNNPQSLRERGAAEPEVGGERIATVVRGDRDADTGKVCGEYGVCPW